MHKQMRRNMSEDKRMKVKEMLNEAKRKNDDQKKQIFLKNEEQKTQEALGKKGEGKKNIKIEYTIMDGLVSKKTELTDYLRKEMQILYAQWKQNL